MFWIVVVDGLFKNTRVLYD